MSLTLYFHPLASFCHKVLIALYENRTRFRAEIIDFSNPDSAAKHLERWPVGKIPVLHDGSRDEIVPETSIIIEYLQCHYPGDARMLPDDPDANLQARLWDRFFDHYVSVPMRKIVTDRLRPANREDPAGVEEATRTLDVAYSMIDARVAEGPWMLGDSFSIADCSAAPGLFFAAIVHPFDEGHAHLHDYFERLLDRPSFKRVLAEARPYFPMFPYRDSMPERFLVPQAD